MEAKGKGKDEARAGDEPLGIASDHAGYALKESIKKDLLERGLRVEDFGSHGEESVDYPDYGERVAEAVSSGRLKSGILVCGSGMGMAMVANKFPGVRGALCHDEETARLAREHNDANILIVGGRVLNGALASRLVRVWLETPFAGGRHKRRLEKIRAIEERTMREGPLPRRPEE